MARDPSRRPRMKLRVIAGELRGRRLAAAAGTQVRPTADRVREALFDILGRGVEGAMFLDAYAGTGAVGIEALSRGAAGVTFVEARAEVVALLRRNLETIGDIRARAQVLADDLARAIRHLESRGTAFDIVYLDPPYAGGELDRALRLLSRSRLLSDRATIVAEHESRRAAPIHEGLAATRSVCYGRAALTFLRRAPAR